MRQSDVSTAPSGGITITMIRQLAYSSIATVPITSGALEDIAAGAAKFNEDNGVTGLLLCDGRRFLQLIEGPVDRIDACMARIRMDGRHRDLCVVREARAAARAFDGWALSFRALGTDQGDQARFVAGVKTDVARVADPALKALFIGFAVIGQR